MSLTRTHYARVGGWETACRRAADCVYSTPVWHAVDCIQCLKANAKQRAEPVDMCAPHGGI